MIPILLGFHSQVTDPPIGAGGHTTVPDGCDEKEGEDVKNLYHTDGWEIPASKP